MTISEKPLIAFFHHPSSKAPFGDVDYGAWARNLIKNATSLGHEIIHMCLVDGPDFGCERVIRSGLPEETVHEGLLARQALAERRSSIWFLDTDCVMQESLPHLDCDIALTHRPIFYDCYNAGVLYSGARGAEVLQELLDNFPTKLDPPAPFPVSDVKVWWGEQRAYRDYFNARPPGDYIVNGFKVQILPCEIWNYTPEFGEACVGKKVLHFKGNIKKHVRLG